MRIVVVLLRRLTLDVEAGHGGVAHAERVHVVVALVQGVAEVVHAGQRGGGEVVVRVLAVGVGRVEHVRRGRVGCVAEEGWGVGAVAVGEGGREEVVVRVEGRGVWVLLVGCAG